MTRTPLLRSLVRLAGLCRRAQQQGTPPDALLAQEREGAARGRGDWQWTRRKFFRRAVVAAAALGVPGSLAMARPRSRPRIAIVGAGIAGLNCALNLSDKGVPATVYEASGRIGGRMFSNSEGYWADNQVTEWGGELIDTDHRTIHSLAARFGLELDDLLAAEPPGSEETYYFSGDYYPRSQVLEDFEPVLKAVQKDARAAGYPTTFAKSTPAGRRLDDMSVWEWVESRVPGGHLSPMGQLLDTAYAIEYGADTVFQSALNLVYLLSGSSRDFQVLGASDERYHVRGGNQQIPMAIANHLAAAGMPVQTGMRLLAIRQQPAGSYELVFDSLGTTREVIADMVVLTLPFAVLRTLEYDRAGFDELKSVAIDELGRGKNGKLHLQFSQRIWAGPGPWGISTGSSYGDTGYQNTWDVTRAQPGVSGILNDYTGGSVTDQLATTVPFAYAGNADVQTDAARFLQQISPVFPGLPALWNGKATFSAQHRSPYFNCSYSFWRVGQSQRFGGYERVRQGNVFFAGEHTSVDYQGYMEGGASEGERAAREVRQLLGRV